MRRFAVIIALGGLLSMFGGAVTASPALADTGARAGERHDRALPGRQRPVPAWLATRGPCAAARYPGCRSLSPWSRTDRGRS
jgi:hypothetical protein